MPFDGDVWCDRSRFDRFRQFCRDLGKIGLRLPAVKPAARRTDQYALAGGGAAACEIKDIPASRGQIRPSLIQVAGASPARRVSLARETVIVLDLLAGKLDLGNNWIQGRYRYRGKFCLAGALRDIQSERMKRDMASEYLGQAIAEIWGDKLSIIAFNDSRSDYADVHRAIEHARRAAADQLIVETFLTRGPCSGAMGMMRGLPK